MKVLVTGARGQLGRTLLANSPPGWTLLGVDRSQLDITDSDRVRAHVNREKPDVIVNTAAYSAVDLAETNEADARQANADGPRHLARAASETGARLIHLSTDFVFDGHATSPYDPKADTNPLSAYGRSKRDGEQQVRDALPTSSVILRTAWLYSEYGGNFVSTMLRLMHERDELSIVSDQVGSPTWARSVADVIFALVARPELAGNYHWTDAGQVSWYDFACAIQEEAVELGLISKSIDIRPIASADYQAAATRPTYSVLDCSATARDLGLEQAPWRQNLRAMLEVSARQ
ncbi:MAG: dTDP-4-dehydrorhamnose reductase [Gammaproteobacteria bacterium]|nr:dTDP-4-dehydrorhamnose reductase [Gammaproteobacteria bacterium]